MEWLQDRLAQLDLLRDGSTQDAAALRGCIPPPETVTSGGATLKSDLECAICLNVHGSGFQVRWTDCGHPFCDSCLRTYVQLRIHREQ
eukprot:4101643-Prymnesium_polylepis.1